MKPRLYKISKGFAQRNKIPIFFVAKPIIETDKALYLYGHGTRETLNMGVCCNCGLTLTHPVSVKLGIGPICGGHYWDWNLVGGFTEENVERLKKEIGTLMKDIKVDTWLPKRVIISTSSTEEDITIPFDHPKLNKKQDPKPTRGTELIQTSSRAMIKITFPFDHKDLDRIRTLPDRKWDGENKYWTTPLTVDAVELLKEWEFSMDPRLEEYLQTAKLHVSQVNEIEVPGLRGTLYPFQKKGVAFIEAKGGRALVADEMGLGKTIQALAWLQLHPELRPVVIVVPASLKLNWEREIMNWMTDWGRIEILHGTKPGIFMKDKLNKASIIIINYDILSYWIDTLLKYNPQILITDECHYYKNNSAKRTKAIKKLGKRIPHVIALSGTPIVNRPVEVFNAIKLIDDTVVSSFWEYAQKYCGARNNGYGWDFSGATNTQELHERLTNTIMIRRKKADVLPDLPEKTRSFIPMELENEEEYCKAERDFIAFVRKEKGCEAADRASNAQALAEIEGLKQLAVRGKLKHAVDWIRDFLEIDEKLVVFATHKFVIDTLMLAFSNKAVKVDGSVTGVNRQKAVDDFQNDLNIRLFVGNIKAAGVGITLTAASNVAFLELPWTPGEVTQAEDRTHRIGQEHSVNIHYLLACNTIEERIARLIDKKRRVLDAVLDGVETEEESLLTGLMNEYKI